MSNFVLGESFSPRGKIWYQPDELFEEHALNARMIAKPGDKFILGKPSEHQHIDLCMADVLAHEAASDARADNWPAATDTPNRSPEHPAPVYFAYRPPMATGTRLAE